LFTPLRDALFTGFCDSSVERLSPANKDMAMITAHRSFRVAARLLSCARGNVALMFALMALPLAMMAGFGVDLWRQNTAVTSAQSALDAAILAAAATDLEDEDALTAVVSGYLAANLHHGGLSTDYNIEVRY
jgi:Flp pilus assembly protein TadG